MEGCISKEEQETSPAQRLLLISKQIAKMVGQMEGFQASSDGGGSTYGFLYPPSGRLRVRMAVETVLKNCLITVSVVLGLHGFWDNIVKLGVNRLYNQINTYNSQNNELFRYEFHEPTKTLVARLICHSRFACSQISKLIFSRLGNLFQLVNPLIPVQEAKPAREPKLIDLIMSAIEQDRSTRAKSSTVSPLDCAFISNADCIEKRPLTTAQLQKFTGLLTNYEKQLKKKFSSQAKILRWIKQVNIIKDDSWANNDGCFGAVEKVNATYKISSELSINVETNLQIAKLKQLTGSSRDLGEASTGAQQGQCKQEEKTVVSYLVRKTSLGESADNNFTIQKKLLAFMRGEKCYAINSFYCQESDNIDSIKHIYSDFYERKIDHRFDKVKVYLKIMLCLFEGLLFLRWNGISHRDLKPDNILLSKDYVCKIIDFGSGCHNKYFSPSTAKEKKVLAQDLLTNQYYNLRYSVLPKPLKEVFFRGEYEQHPFFDVYAFGVLLNQFFGNEQAKVQLGEYQWELLRFFSHICTQSNPDDRPDPRCAYVLFGEVIKGDKA